MANLVLGLITIATLMTGALTFTVTTITGAQSNADAYATAAEARHQFSRSSLRHLPTCVVPPGTTILATIENDGQSSLGDFDDWKVFAHSEAYSYSENTPPAAGEWSLTDLRLANGRSEVFGSGILDPGERVTLTVELTESAIDSGLTSLRVVTGEGAAVDVTFRGTITCGYYLHNNPTPPTGDTLSQADLVMDTAFPRATVLHNYDSDRDAAAGRLVQKGGAGADENDLTKYQNWRTAPLTLSLQLSDPIRVDTVLVEFWAAVADFNTSARGDVEVYLREYDGATYTEIGNVAVTSDPWDASASGTWVKANATFTGLDYTLPIGSQLEVKLVVPDTSAGDMWLAYDTISYPASLTVADSLDLVFHTDEQKTGDLTSFLAKEGTHDDGYYLHNNPTPPVVSTTSQANLSTTTSYPSATTLVNYDSDRDAQPGLVLLQGGSGATESDLTNYQNWRGPVSPVAVDINGPVSVNIWSAVKDFNTSLAGELKFFLRDYDGSTYTEIVNGTLTATPWDPGATGTWVNRLLEIPSVDYTLAAGHQLELKVIVGTGSGGDMWLAYDTASYDSVLRLPGQRDRDAIGRPRVAQADAGASTGRFSPDVNGGRILFPLDGQTRLADAEWTARYRVRRNGWGWVWDTSATDITPGSSGTWVNVDISAFVPAGAQGAILEIINTHPSSGLSAVARGVEDTREYMPDGNSQKIPGRSHRWQVVKIDSNLEIQLYVENTSDIVVNLLGHTLGTDPVFYSSPPDITPGTTGSWTTVDVSSNVTTDTMGVVLLIDGTANEASYGIRETGSTFSSTARTVSAEGNTMYAVGIDSSGQFDIYLDDASINVYLIARTERSLVFYDDDIAVTDPTPGSWQPVDADSYSIPSVASGLLLYAHNTQNKRNDFGIRQVGSAIDLDKGLWSDGHVQGAVGLDSDNVWEEYLGSANVDVSIAAYTTGENLGPTTLHADMDVLVRKANGQLRATLDTDVANSLSIDVTNEWATITATYTPPAYVIVDQTDYLEFNIFAEVTFNDGEDTTMQFMFDDNTVAPDEQAGIENVGFFRK